MTPSQRNEARKIIFENAVDYAVVAVSATVIDRINILNASILAMHKALDNLRVQPGNVLVDGNRFKPWNYTPYTTVIKGDAKFANIAAASILAKTTRDDIMDEFHRVLPGYGFASHKGYPTKQHYEAIQCIGPSPWHRFSFRLQPR